MSGAFPALIAGISDNEPLPGGDCGCCDGIAPVTPLIPANRPGLAAIAYVPGRYADFLESELAALSAHENPALSRLQSRETDDFSIALLDAWAVTLDVLSFYQERIANESYLPTATERRSLVELGYSPGTVDDRWGPRTANALRAFQAAQGIRADGIFGPVSRLSMRQALARR